MPAGRNPDASNHRAVPSIPPSKRPHSRQAKRTSRQDRSSGLPAIGQLQKCSSTSRLSDHLRRTVDERVPGARKRATAAIIRTSGSHHPGRRVRHRTTSSQQTPQTLLLWTLSPFKPIGSQGGGQPTLQSPYRRSRPAQVSRIARDTYGRVSTRLSRAARRRSPGGVAGLTSAWTPRPSTALGRG
jgi:hypothetical protein